MHNSLKFVLTKTDGGTVEQEIPCIPEKVGECVRDMFIQYAQMGMVKKEGDKMTCLMASQIATAEVELPTIVIATPAEAPQGEGTEMRQGPPRGGVTLT